MLSAVDYTFLTLFLLLYRIKCDLDVIKEQRKIASRPQHKNNLAKTLGETVITTAITADDEKFDDNELGEVFVQNFKLYENLDSERNKNGAIGTIRKTRAAVNETSKHVMECLSCFANGSSTSDGKCYKGSSLKKIKCRDAEICFTELHPLYIRRGCILHNRVNRTFACKCPLCNDKPSSDLSFYEYKTLDEWEFDNILLQKPLTGVELMCKVCETQGTDPENDKNCRAGKNANYMVCGHNQVCFINIDDEIGHVTRGCTTSPVYNSVHYFCSKTKCNTEAFKNPKQGILKKTSWLTEKKKLSSKNSGTRIANSSSFFVWTHLLLLKFIIMTSDN